MKEDELYKFLSVSGIDNEFIKYAVNFYKRRGKGHAVDFYRGEKKNFRRIHISYEVLRGYVKALDDVSAVNKIIEIWERYPFIDRRIRGDFHTHTEFSDSMDDTEAIIRKASALGYSWIALTDHAFNPGNPSYTMSAEKYLRRTEIAEKIAGETGIKVYHSIEANIMEDGTLDIPDIIREKIPFALASLHKLYNHPDETLLKRIDKAMADEKVLAFTHPFFALNVREHGSYIGEIIDIVEGHGRAVELNMFPFYFSGNELIADEIKDRDVKVIFSTDEHCVNGMNRMRFADYFIEKLNPLNILNFSKSPVEDFFKKQKNILKLIG